MNESTPSDSSAPAVDSQTKPLGDVIAINEALIKDHLNKVVVTTVEETLNALLDAEADQLCRQGQSEGVGTRFAIPPRTCV